MTVVPITVASTGPSEAEQAIADAAAQPDRPAAATVELSIVIPCLNESETVAGCVTAAREALRDQHIQGEVIVADNGSTDGSRNAAERAGARVVAVTERGYGSALMGGIAAAGGRYVLIGDADQSYDFHEAPQFLAKLRQGYELVQGCRLEAGGGTVRPGAMRPLHQWWGNPMFSWLARRWFGAPVNDVHCGMRAFSTAWYRQIGLRCTGMEFASEMVIKAALGGARIAEVPITLYPDARRGRHSHLRTFRDGWRHLRFYLIYGPQWLFFAPGIMLLGLGILGYAVGMPKLRVGHVTFECPHATLRQLGADMRLPIHPVRRVYEGLCHRRRPVADGPALGRVVSARHAREGAASGARRHDRWDRAPCGRGLAVASPRLRRSRLRPHNALGDPWHDADRARLPDPAVQFFPQHLGAPPTLMASQAT